MRISDWISDVCSSDLRGFCKDLANQRLRLPRLAAPIIIIGRLLVGLVAMDIWADHAGAVAADSRRIIGFGEKLVELGIERVAPAEQADPPLDVVRPEPQDRKSGV